jgi:hypothetical protein
MLRALTVRVENLSGHIPSSVAPDTTDGFFVTYKNAWSFSVFWLARRTSVFNLSAMFF